jgi:hypothetical protein
VSYASAGEGDARRGCCPGLAGWGGGWGVKTGPERAAPRIIILSQATQEENKNN